jgi:MFS family permease
MAAIGLHDTQIGTVASLGLAAQLLWTVFSGAVIDKFGRRRIMLVFGIITWMIPCLLWATAKGYWYFIIAVVFNGMWRITGNCFSCMLVEDCDTDQLINIYAILNILGLLAGFLSPVIGIFIDRYTLVPTMRAVYFAAMVIIGAKYVLHYHLTRESSIGLRRIEECRGRSLFSLTFGGWGAFASALREPRLLAYVALMALVTCYNTVQAAFWPLFVTSAYRVSEATLSIFPLVKAAATLAVYLIITPRIRLSAIRSPLLCGFGAQALGLAALFLCLPLGGAALPAVFFSAVCDAFALAVLSPLCESLLSVTVPPSERARVNSLIAALVLLFSIPIGWIAGLLSQENRMLPLLMNLCLVAAETLLALRISRRRNRENDDTQAVSAPPR